MLNSSYVMKKKSSSIQKANFSHYTHDCVKAFIKMNFKLNINIKCWEHIADMYIWYNNEIIDPDTNRPFDNSKKPWSLIFADKLKFLYQLTNFKFGKYKGTPAINGDPAVPQLRWLTTDELNNEFSTPTHRVRFSTEVWNKLINAIPDEWTSTLLSGNQTFYNDEYLATVIGNEIGDVYKCG